MTKCDGKENKQVLALNPSSQMTDLLGSSFESLYLSSGEWWTTLSSGPCRKLHSLKAFLVFCRSANLWGWLRSGRCDDCIYRVRELCCVLWCFRVRTFWRALWSLWGRGGQVTFLGFGWVGFSFGFLCNVTVFVDYWISFWSQANF